MITTTHKPQTKNNTIGGPDLQLMRSGSQAYYNLAMKAARLRQGIYNAQTPTKEKDKLRRQLYTTNYLISVLIRNTGGTYK